MLHRILFIIATIMLITAPLSASFAKGDVNVGDKIPHDLTLQDHTGKTRSFSDLSGKKGLILVFIRSANWCPFCQKQLIELDKKNTEFNKQGYKIVSVSYDGLDDFKKFVTKNKPNITLLSDPKSESIQAFGILNESKAKGTRSYGIPHPGVYIISKDKKVQAKFFEKGFRKRPSAADILAKVKQLNPPPPKPKPSVQYKSLDQMGQDPIDPVLDIIDTPTEDLSPVLPAINTSDTSITPQPVISEEAPLQAPEILLSPSSIAPPKGPEALQ